MTVEGFHALYDALDAVGAVGVVYLVNVGGVDGVQLQDVVIHAQQGVVYLRAVNHRRVREHAHLGLRTVLVA